MIGDETTQPSPQVKVALHQLCMAYADECIRHAQHAMEDARQSANNETKSSAGDKHETGRALLQLEQEKNTRQLMEAKASKERLLKIDPLNISSIVSLGSVVITSSGNFYIAIAAGKLENEGIPYFAISPVSPIAMQFLGHVKNDIVIFNGRAYEIRYIL